MAFNNFVHHLNCSKVLVLQISFALQVTYHDVLLVSAAVHSLYTNACSYDVFGTAGANRYPWRNEMYV